MARKCICWILVEDAPDGRVLDAESGGQEHRCTRPEWDKTGWPANMAAQVVADRQVDYPEGMLASEMPDYQKLAAQGFGQPVYLGRDEPGTPGRPLPTLGKPRDTGRPPDRP